MTTPYEPSVALKPDLELRLAQAGSGRPALILHGGAGPTSVNTLVAHLSKNMQTITPTHPGWDGAPRPEWMSGVSKLAQTYLRYLYETGLHDVLVVGSSIGGWIAVEMAVRDVDHRIGALVLIDPVGIAVAGEPILNVFENPPPSVFEATFFDPAKFAPNPATMTEERVAQQRSNMAALRALAGEPYMHDPGLWHASTAYAFRRSCFGGRATGSRHRHTVAPTPPHSRTRDSRRSSVPAICRMSSNPRQRSQSSTTSHRNVSISRRANGDELTSVAGAWERGACRRSPCATGRRSDAAGANLAQCRRGD